MNWLTNTPFLRKERGFFIAERYTGRCFMPIRITCQNKKTVRGKMKILKQLIIVSIFAFFLLSCRSLFKESAYSPVNVDFSKYDNIHVDWVDLIEKDWRMHGYSNEDEWKNDIEYLNLNFQKYLEEYYLIGKKLTFSNNKNFADYPIQGLLIKFGDVFIDYSHYQLYLSIKFVDLKTNQTLLELERRAYFGNQWGFAGFLHYSLYEVSKQLSWVIMKIKY
ncbi:MAG: hypothetical protein LLG97_09680 [Deltaproteobacteria bacterium]|nr:hypothetical protein [Deltaproteobacteria bacterium]